MTLFVPAHLRRPLLHAAAIAALLALGGLLQYGLHRPWGGYRDLGWWLWVPAAVTVVGGIGCAVGGFYTARGGVVVPAWVLVVPAVVAGLAAVAWIGEVGALVEQIRDPGVIALGPTAGDRMVAEAAMRCHQKAYLALTWAGLGFAAAAVVAGCRPPPAAQNPDVHRTVLWRAMTISAVVGCGAIAAFLFKYTAVITRLRHSGVNAWTVIQKQTLGLHEVDAAWMVTPMFAAVAVIALLPILVLALWPRQNPLDEISDHARASARAAGAAAQLGVAATLGLAMWVKASPTLISFLWYSTTLFRRWELGNKIMAGEYPDPWLFYRTGVTSIIAITVAGVLVSLPLLVTAGRHTRRWLLPMGILLLTIAGLGVSRSVAVTKAHRAFGPLCNANCVERDKAVSLLCLQRYPKNSEMLRDKCYVYSLPEDVDFRLPRAESTHCPMVSVRIATRRSKLKVDGVSIIELMDWGTKDDSDPSSGGPRLLPVLEEKADDARAIAARNPNQPFDGLITLALDERTPMGLVDRIRRTALEASFHDQALIVHLPGSSRIPRHRTIRLEAPVDDRLHAPWEPLPPGNYWILHIGIDTVTLAFPDGSTQTADDAPTLASQLRGALITPGTDPLWVTHDANVTLGQELAARATLIDAGLFIDAYSLPFGTGGLPPDLL